MSDSAALWNDAATHTRALGCFRCPYKSTCGGLSVESGVFNCLAFCCGQPAKCDMPCAREPSRLAARAFEVGGFGFDNITRPQRVLRPSPGRFVPMLYHGSCRRWA